METNSPILPVSCTATPTEPTDAAQLEAARDARREQDRDYYRAMLHELADMAMDLARAVHRQATQPSPEDTTAQPAPASAALPNAAAAATAFDRIARTVRRTVALARTLDDPPPAPRGPRQDGPGNARRRSRYDRDRDASDLDDPDDLDDGYDLNDDDLDNDDLDDESYRFINNLPPRDRLGFPIWPAADPAAPPADSSVEAEAPPAAQPDRETAPWPDHEPASAPSAPPQPGTGPPPA